MHTLGLGPGLQWPLGLRYIASRVGYIGPSWGTLCLGCGAVSLGFEVFVESCNWLTRAVNPKLLSLFFGRRLLPKGMLRGFRN